MQVICIDNGSNGYGSGRGLTLNKVYDVIDDNWTHSYLIIDDKGDKTQYIIQRFKLLSEVREEKINEILK